jgi:hypothetical protein
MHASLPLIAGRVSAGLPSALQTIVPMGLGIATALVVAIGLPGSGT